MCEPEGQSLDLQRGAPSATRATLELSRPWWRTAFAALDVEGTGWQDGQDELIELAMVRIEGGLPTTTMLNVAVNPGRPIRRFFQMPHRLKDDDVADAPAFDAVRPSVESAVNGAILVAHNAWVDWRMLSRKCPDCRPVAVLDTLRLSRTLYPTEKRHGLDALVKRFDLEGALLSLADTARHRALYDAMAVAHVFTILARRGEARTQSLQHLFDLCAIKRPDGTPTDA